MVNYSIYNLFNLILLYVHLFDHIIEYIHTFVLT